MTKGERLRYIVDSVCGGSQARFARETGLDKFSLNKMIKGTATISEKTILRIVERYGAVNADYIRGKSDYAGEFDNVVVKTKDEIIAEKDAEIEFLRKSIALLERLVADSEKLSTK